MSAPRAVLLLGGWIAAAAIACSDAASTGGPAQPAEPAPRFWLVDTKLAAAPGQEPTRAIRGPVLVELLPGGKVRSAPGAAEAFEGYVPEGTLHTPADRRGLMLHGQRVSEMHLDSPSGPVLGRIHPGAFVSVAPHDGATWLVAVPRYARENRPVLAYVQKDALGPAPREPRPPSLGGKVMRDFPFTLWDNASSRVLVDQLLCGDFHVTVEGSSVRGTQLHDGIEVSGLLETGPLPWPWGEQGENTCMGRRIFRRDGQLREGRGRDWLDSVPIDSVPGGYRRVDVPAADPFAAILRSQASVF